jgi:hypothetical protein
MKKKAKTKTKPQHAAEPPITHEAKQMIALAFEGSGGLPALTTWARTHRALFYSQVYPKLLPLQVNASTVNVNVEAEGSYRQKIHAALAGIIAARKTAPERTIDVTPVKAASGSPNVEPDSPPDPIAPAPQPAPEPAAPDPPNVVRPKEFMPNATDLWHEWPGHGSHGCIRPRDWGPI